MQYNGFGGLGVACWPLVPKFAGFKTGRSRRIFFQGEKILTTPSFGGEVKPSVPCRRFAACKRFLNLRGSRNLSKITGQFVAHSSTVRCQDLSRRCGRTGTWRRKWERLKAGKAIANYSQELALDAVFQSHTSHMTGLWFLPARPLRLNTNE